MGRKGKQTKVKYSKVGQKWKQSGNMTSNMRRKCEQVGTKWEHEFQSMVRMGAKCKQNGKNNSKVR